MNTDKLYLFRKDTDASAAMRGYQYQVFKTLETWLDNFLSGREETIYCDYEEDIFQHDEVTRAARFRQLKLYSSNFSFSSEEIQKALAHFFMLHVKTDPAVKDKEFIFEANSSIAGNWPGNQADLLRRWVAAQDALPVALLSECAQQVQDTVSAYIEGQAAEMATQLAKRAAKYPGDPQKLHVIEESQRNLREALAVFSQLTKQDWEDFTRSIKWYFEGVGPDEAFASAVARVDELIAALPFDIPQERQPGLAGVLCKWVVVKSSAQTPPERRLTAEELRGLLLQSGTKEEQWYQEVYNRWHQAGRPSDFRVGEFYEVLKAVKSCRWHPQLTAHDEFWLGLLDWYLDQLVGRPAFRRRALYERLMLRLRLTEYMVPPRGDLFGCENQLREYFSHFSVFTDATDFEDAQSLLFITWTTSVTGKSDLSREEANAWVRQYHTQLKQRLVTTTDPSELCRLLDARFGMLFVLHKRRRTEENIPEIMAPLEELFQHLQAARLYNASQLSTRLHTYVRLLIQWDEAENELMIETLQDYLRRLDEVVGQRAGAHNAARKLVAEGVEYLKSRKPTALLRALKLFHEAKDRWLLEETFEGYTLALLNISQVYSGMNLHLAAKYYGLWAAWVSLQKGERELMKRIAQGYGMAFHADFQQGAWFSALLDFERYMIAYHEFDTAPLDGEHAEMSRKIIFDYVMLLYAAPVLDPALQVLANVKLAATGYLKEELDEVLHLVRSEIPEATLLDALGRKLTDSPLNDAGPQRSIQFQALGLMWRIDFCNSYEMTALAEEFGAVLQILLAEIALSKTDFHLTGGVVKLELETSAQPKPPKQLPDNAGYRWQAFVQEIETTDYEQVKQGVAWVTIALKAVLQEISLLPDAEFDQAFWRLFEQHNLGTKSLQTTSYQRMYRLLFPHVGYEEFQRQAFNSSGPLAGLPAANPFVPRTVGISKKYNQETALRNIRSRYRNAKPSIYLTLGRLKQDLGYVAWLADLRQAGWQDWQIVIAMMNFMVSYKANRVLESESFESEEAYVKALQQTFADLLGEDEKDSSVVFPLAAFQSPDFQHKLDQTAFLALPAFGLERKSRFPNFAAVRTFLNERFNMSQDAVDDLNPLL
ncbi:MAG: hypothetical protein ACRYFX_17910 [Janthinobacterium lividum]